MKAMWHLKLVPDNAPNDDGHWEEHVLETEPDYDIVVKEGYHVVQIKRAPWPVDTDPPVGDHASAGLW